MVVVDVEVVEVENELELVTPPRQLPGIRAEPRPEGAPSGTGPVRGRFVGDHKQLVKLVNRWSILINFVG